MDATGAVNLSMGGVSTFKKGEQPKLGSAYGAWENRPTMMGSPLGGGAMLDFNLDALTLDDFNVMRYHPQINSSLSVLTFMLHQVDWKIESKNKRIANMVEENMRAIWTRLIRAMGQSFWAGYSPSILEYENDAQGVHTIINKVKDLSPLEAQVKWRKVERRVEGRNRHAYFYDGITQIGYGDVPVLNTFWYPLLMENGNYYGRKLLKSAYAPWYYSQLMHIYTNRYFERFGEPLPIGRAPFEWETVDADGTRYTGKQVMEEVIHGIRSRSTVVLPSDRDGDVNVGSSAYDFDIQYLESQMRGVDFERYMARLDEEMSLSLFTPLLLLRNTGEGSHNLGVQHTQTWLWMLNALTGDIKEYIDRFICDRLKSINFSPNADKVEWVPRKLGKESNETIRAVVTELIRRGEVKPDIEELGVQLGLTLTQVRQTIQDPDVQEPNPDNVDDRQRTERDRSRAGDARGTASDRVPGTRTIANRVRQQAALTWSTGTIQLEELNDFERVALGDAADYVNGIITALDGLDVSEFDGVDMMMNVFNAQLDHVEQRSA